MRPRSRFPAVLAALACLPVLAGCGASGAGGGSDDPDPAKAIGSGALVYAEATFRPEGDQADAVESLVKRVANIDDPGERIVQYLESQSENGEDVSYEKDVEPWIGRRVGFGVSGTNEDDLDYVAALGVKDADKAKDFVADQSKDDKKGSYEGTDYYTDAEGTIVGVAGDYLLLAEKLPQLKAAIDQVGKDKGSIADSKAFEDATGDLPDDRLGTFFVNPTTFKELVKRDPEIAGGPGAGLIDQAFGGLKGVAGALTAQDTAAVAETRVTTDGENQTLSLFGPGVAPALVREAPADSLVVYGVKDFGGTYQKAFQQAVGGLGGAALQGQLQSQLGIDINRDVFSWLGDTTVFVRGGSLQDLDGAVMIDAKDVTAASQAIPKLIGLARQRGDVPFDPVQLGGADQAFSATVPGLPQPLFVARKGDRVVIGLGEDATRAGLQPSSTIDANGAYDKAKQVTGGFDPSIIVDLQRAVDLLEQSGAGGSELGEAKPYLEALNQLVAGSKRDGGTYVSRVAITVE